MAQGTFYITTFGCRTNQADSDAIRQDLLAAQWREADSIAQADVVIVNSCTVTHRSDQQVRQLTRRLHRENPRARIVVTGCYAERDPAAVGRVEGVWAVVGNRGKEELPILLDEARETAPGAGISESPAKPRVTRLWAGLPGETRTRPMVKIQDGCDAKCSYCIVPVVRGAGRSVPPEEIYAQVRAWARLGFPEIVLTGIHIGTYGLHLKPRCTLDQLVARLATIPELGWIRLSSIEPMRLSLRIVEVAATTGKLAPHFHICLQSGSDTILRRMLRPYDTARFGRILKAIHDRLPDAALGTDVIVGFPGETEAEHRESLDFIAASPFAYLHVFPYSDRSGTRASEMPGKVPPEVVRRRAEEMRELGRRKAEAFRRSFLGRELDFITLTRTRRGRREGLSANYLKVLVYSDLPPNRIFRGRAIRETGEYLVLDRVEER
ncbi:MAG: tRNA (N(6)-L-threonylcarbamoyladenosine(37)-C(2))-methylthiotransferase MtaB [Acidobacteriota bacterium]